MANRRLIGRYTLYDEIAAGGLGSVHLAVASAAGGFRKVIAIKRLHEPFRKDKAFTSAFLDEARLSAKISHANVVQTLDAVVTDGEVLLVMEYVPGEALHRLLEAAHGASALVPLPVASAIAVGVLYGLAAAHGAADERGAPLGLVHRDVSPQNVLVGVDGVARLLDFGLARALGRSQVTRDGQVKGKLGYMAPEQFAGAALNQRADLYACGVVLWELLTGTRLFSGDSDAVTAARLLDYTVPPPSELRSGIPVALNRVVLRALARNPTLRYESAEAMATALESALAPASTATVGGWVRSLAPDALASRAAACAAAERSAASLEKRGRVARMAALCTLGLGVPSAFFMFRSGLVAGGPPASASAVLPASATATAVAIPSSIDAAPAEHTDRDRLPPPAESASAARPARPVTTPIASDRRPPDCNPPYEIDSAGRKTFKRECL